MKDLTLDTLLAVFEEVFGVGLFWALVAVAGVITLAFFWVLLRDRHLKAVPLLRAELLAPVGAVASIWFVFAITSSGLKDMGGPIDVIVLLLIGVAGGIGSTILVYVMQALFSKSS